MRDAITPKQVAVALGVSEASVKRWCDSGSLPASRTGGGHRRIEVADVLTFARRHGRRIDQPEVLSLPRMAGRSELAIDRARGLVRLALEAGRQQDCSALIWNLYLAGHSARAICDLVLAPAFHDIGQRWTHGEVEVFEERRAVEICRRLLEQLRGALPDPPADAPVAIGGTLAGDPYMLATTMVELALCEAGWRGQSYGCGHPAETLCSAIERVRPKLFWLSVSAAECDARLIDQVVALSDAAETHGVALVVGGRALTEQVRKAMHYSAHCDTLAHLVAFAQTLWRRPAEV